MSDRLTQLQICLDQLIDQFTATVNYINVHAPPALLDDDPTSVSNRAAKALPPQGLPGQPGQAGQQLPQDQQLPPAQQQENGKEKEQDATQAKSQAAAQVSLEDNETEFNTAIEELSTDIVLKSRQISILIDSLPGIGVSSEDQLKQIGELYNELKEVEQKRLLKIKEKDELIKNVDDLIVELASNMR